MVKATGWFGRKEVKQMAYVVLASLLCFVGPTYFFAALSDVVPQVIAIVLGLLCFLVGIVFVLKLVEE